MKMSIQTKLTASFAAVGCFSALILGLLVAQESGEALLDAKKEGVAVARDLKKQAMDSYFQNLEANIKQLADLDKIDAILVAGQAEFAAGQGPASIDGLNKGYDKLNQAIQGVGSQRVFDIPRTEVAKRLQASYFKELIKGDELTDSSTYAAVHLKVNKYLDERRMAMELYDIFVISSEGDIVYTCAKEADFARNIETDECLKDSGLKRVVDKARQTPGQVRFEDFSPYAPSKEQPAAFAAVQLEKGKPVVAVQLSDLPLTEIINRKLEGKAQLGECLLLGSDGSYRSNDYHFQNGRNGKEVTDRLKVGNLDELFKAVEEAATKLDMNKDPAEGSLDQLAFAYREALEGGIDKKMLEKCVKYGSNVGILRADNSVIAKRIKKDLEIIPATGDVFKDQGFNANDIADKLYIASIPYKRGEDLSWYLNISLTQDDALKSVRNTQLLILLTMLGVSLLAGLAGLLVARKTARPILVNAAAARDFARGNRNARTNVASNDELGDLARDMNLAFEAANSAELKASDIAAKANSSLEGAATPMMTCGADRIIDYINPSAMKLMRDNEALFNRELKNFNVNTIVGSDVNIYHTQPDKQGRMLQDFSRMPINSFLKVGPKTFRITVTARRDTAGSYVGNTIEWMDVTEQLIAEKRAAGLSSAIENSGTAVMTCDTNRVIDYCNPAVMKVLRDNEAVFRQYLPQFDIGKIIGSCIDIFHKNPSHQARLLTDHSRLPLTAYISVGPKSFRLNLSAKKDQNGVYIGNTVEWLDITAQLASEKKAASLNSVVEAVDTNLMICDLERRITYLNPAAQALMREHAQKFRELFKNFDSEKLIGVCIDGFHKNPAHQANLLGNPRNLPYKTEITAGGMEFALVALPLYDAEGKYIGSGVQWIDNNARARYRNEVTGVIDAAKNGNLSHRGNVAAMDAVYKPMLAGINEVIDAVVAPIAEIREKLAKVSEGDLTAYVTGQYKGDHEMLKNSLNGTLDKLNEILLQVRDASTQMSQGASQVSSTSQMISQGATEQSASLEEISASMNEINSQTKGNAESSGRANQLAQGAKDDAEGGSRNMGRMVQAMSEIDESAQKISKIIKVIDEIAFQTNLLALNAAVEAARAGVHGKGFAVVAEEVRNLAARSANAAKETTELIEGSIKKVNAGSNVAQLTSESLNKIVDGISKVTHLVGEIAAASNEQALGIGQVNQGLVQLDQVTQQNTANAEESAAAAVELSEQGAQLQELIGRFKLQAKAFGGAGGLSGISPDLMDALRAAMAQQGMSMPSQSSSKALASRPAAKPAPKSLFGGHTPPASKSHNDIIPLD